MKRLHLVIGLIVFVVFVITGRLMRIDFPDKDIIPQDFRILVRSRHIYILFMALLNLLLGSYFRPHKTREARILQYAGSLVLIISSILCITAFFLETYSYHHFSDVSRNGLYTALAGVGLHFLAAIVPDPKE
jgi:hypothetical protein